MIVAISIIIVIVMFGLIIFVHEFGHFIMAKLMGVKVNEFSMGMGPKLLSWGKKETKYSLRAFPIGGFCAMEGEDAAGAGSVAPPKKGKKGADASDENAADTDASPAAAAAQTNSLAKNPGGDIPAAAAADADTADTPAPTDSAAPSTDPRAFPNKRPWRRALILLAGAAMNLLLGYILLIPFCAIHYSNGLYPTSQVVQFQKNPISAGTGLQAGDVILKVDGRSVITDFDLSSFMQNGGRTVTDVTVPVTDEAGNEVKDDAGNTETMVLPQAVAFDLTVRRAGQTMVLRDVKFQLTVDDSGQRSLYWDFILHGNKKTVLSTLGQAGKTTASFALMIWYTLGDIVTGKYGLNQLSGPIGVTDVVTQVVAQSGSALFENLLFLITMITINVGIFNLLPLPALDGGRLLFVAAEGISRRKVPAKFESLVHAVGFALLILLMIVIAFSDVFKLFRG